MKRLIIATAVATLTATGSFAQSSDSAAQSASRSGVYNDGDTVYSSTAIAPPGNNTAPCVLHPSLGLGLLGTGVSTGVPYQVPTCLAKDNAALLRDLARMRAAGDPGWRAAVTHLYTNHPTIRQTMIALGWVQKR